MSRTLALGAREQVEIDHAILGGERSAAEIAEDFDLSRRTIVRRRAVLRARGLRFEVPESADKMTDKRRAASRLSMLRNRQAGRRP